MSARPRIVTFLAMGVLTYTGFSWIRFYTATVRQPFLEELPLLISPRYLQATGLVFGLWGLVCFWGLWVGRPGAPLWTRGFVVASALHVWADRLFLSAPQPGLGNTWFALGATAAIIGYVFLIFHSDFVREFFLETS